MLVEAFTQGVQLSKIKKQTKNDAVRIVEYLCHTGCSMSLNFPPKSSSIMLVQKQTKKNVCFVMRNPGLFSGGFRRWHSLCLFVILFFIFFAKRKVISSAPHTLCFACTGGPPKRRPFSLPVDVTVVQKGFFFFSLSFFFFFVQG